jgi:hypothetical protein
VSELFSANLRNGTAREGQIIGCLRKGCFEHTLKIESFCRNAITDGGKFHPYDHVTTLAPKPVRSCYLSCESIPTAINSTALLKDCVFKAGEKLVGESSLTIVRIYPASEAAERYVRGECIRWNRMQI